MNVLFANYGDFSTNSLLHIAGFADQLVQEGHDVIVAAPDWLHTLEAIDTPQFRAATHRQLLDDAVGFADGRRADLFHAWTPREPVVQFARIYLLRAPACRLVVHLEDNEEHLAQVFCNRPFDELAAAPEADLDALLPGWMAHPRHYQFFLAAADGATVIQDALTDFIPPTVPARRLFPCLPPAFLHATTDNPHPVTRELPPGSRLVVYPGGLHHVNFPDFAELAHAIADLNRDGIACHLVRTGSDAFNLLPQLPTTVRNHLRDLGVIRRSELPRLLASADALVQPGGDDPANHYRFPSKLPEFLASGRPVLAPACHAITGLRDGIDWLPLQKGDRLEIARTLTHLWSEPALAHTIGENARTFARDRFDPARNTAALAAFYDALLQQPICDLRRHWLKLERGDLHSIQRFARRLMAGRKPLRDASSPPPTAPWPQPNVRDRLLLELATLETGREPHPAWRTPTAPTFHLKIYPALPGGVSESNTLATRANTGRWTRVEMRFEWEIPTNVEWIRIDPGEAPGWIRIIACEVTGDRHLWLRANRQNGFHGLETAGTAVEAGRDRALEVFSVGNDPQILARWPKGAQKTRQLTIRLRLWVLPLPDQYRGTETLRQIEQQLVLTRTARKKASPFWNRP